MIWDINLAVVDGLKNAYKQRELPERGRSSSTAELEALVHHQKVWRMNEEFKSKYPDVPGAMLNHTKYSEELLKFFKRMVSLAPSKEKDSYVALVKGLTDTGVLTGEIQMPRWMWSVRRARSKQPISMLLDTFRKQVNIRWWSLELVSKSGCINMVNWVCTELCPCQIHWHEFIRTVSTHGYLDILEYLSTSC